jgi:hypothetical protein
VARLHPPLRHPAHRPVRQADPGLDNPTAAPSPTGRAVDLAGAGWCWLVLAGAGWCWPATPSSAWLARSPATGGCRGSGPDPSPPVTRAGPQRVSATSRRARLASRHTETRGQLPRPTQRQQPRASPPLPSHQENQQSRQSRLTGSHNQPNQSPASSATIPSTPTGLNHKPRTPNEMIFEVVGSLRD